MQSNPISSQDLERIQPDNLEQVLRTRRLRWHGHVARSDGWLKKVMKLTPGGGRPKKIWSEMIRKDYLALGLIETHPFQTKVCSDTL